MMLRLLMMAALSLGLSGPTAARPPDFPAPKDANVSQVGDNITVNGRAMSVRAFTTTDSLEQVIEFYQDLWADPPVENAPGYAYDADVIAPWHLMTRVEDGYVLTVQAQSAPDKGAFGLLALGVLPEPGEPPPAAPAPPSLNGSQVLSNVLSDDRGQSGQTSIVVNEKSLASNVDFYRNHYRSWRSDMDQAVGDRGAHAMSFTRGRRQVHITIQGDRDGSRIVINSVKHDVL